MPSVTRGAPFEKTAPLDPPQKLLIRYLELGSKTSLTAIEYYIILWLNNIIARIFQRNQSL